MARSRMTGRFIPWVEADLENGQWMGDGSNPADTGNSSDFVTAVLKNDGQRKFELEGGNAQSGGLTTYWNGPLPSGYSPMDQEGAIVLGTGGDNSHSDVGSFFEGVMTKGVPSDSADAAVQSGIVSAGYAGNSSGSGGGPGYAAAGSAVVHDGYSSVYTADSANGHLQESYLPKLGDSWSTQDLSAEFGTPPVMPGTRPVALVHDGYTSVYTVDDSNSHLQETYLPAIGDSWNTQDLSAKYGTPQVQPGTSPVSIVHSGYTSVYTVDANHDLQETYLPKLGGPWSTQDLSAKYGTPAVAPGTQPEALYHTGYSSVYTVDGGSDHLQETYLASIGAPWATQDFTAKYGTPSTAETLIPLLHPDASGNLTWTSVYSIDESSNHLQETYLPAIGDAWTSQDLSAKYGTPPVAVAQFSTSTWSVGHDGYTSVYTVDASNGHLQETYLPKLGGPWSTQDLSAEYGTPPSDTTPSAVFHTGYTSVYTVDASTGHLWETYLPALGGPWHSQDLSANYETPAVASRTSPVAILHSGWTSVYTVNGSNGHLQETYLPAIGDSWTTQDLTAKYGTPSTSVTPAAVVHNGFTSVYTVDANHDLQETYLPAIGDSWTTQDLTAKYGTPQVAAGMAPMALYHTGYTSVYTVDASNGDLQETYLPAIGDSWTTQDLTAKYGTPAPNQPPSALVHYDTSGGLTWTSLFTVDAANDHLQETYLPAIGDSWTTQDLTAKYGTPPV